MSTESKRVILLPKLVVADKEGLRAQSNLTEQIQYLSNIKTEDSLLHSKLKGQVQKSMNYRHFLNSRIRSQCKFLFKRIVNSSLNAPLGSGSMSSDVSESKTSIFVS